MKARISFTGRSIGCLVWLLAISPAWAEVPWHDAPQALVLGTETTGSGGLAGGSGLGGTRSVADGEKRLMSFGDEGQGLLWDVGKTGLALAAVCALLYVFVRFGLPKLTGARGGTDGLFRVVARFGLEPKRMLYILEVSGKTLLVASSESGVRFLTELDGPASERSTDAGQVLAALSGAGSTGASFYQVLQRKLDRPTLERPEVEGFPAGPGSIRGEVS
jgi:flagellar biogenesis protein FliO